MLAGRSTTKAVSPTPSEVRAFFIATSISLRTIVTTLPLKCAGGKCRSGAGILHIKRDATDELATGSLDVTAPRARRKHLFGAKTAIPLGTPPSYRERKCID